MAGERPLLAILDYGIGNLHSAAKGFEHAGADIRLTTDAGLIADASGVVLPGVGAFAPCMDALRSRGLADVALERIESEIPFFGICVGMQMLFSGSEEAPGHRGLGVFAEVLRLLPDSVKRPQMQWNRLVRPPGRPAHPMLDGLEDEAWVYFVHSYGLHGSPLGLADAELVASCDYGGDVAAAVARGRLWACQFHPEKSGRSGLRILANFVQAAAGSRDGAAATAAGTDR